MRRHLMGIVAILLFIGGVVAYFAFPHSESFQSTAGACIKVGAVLAALWLALPQINQMPLWLYASILGGVIVIARWPQLWWMIIPAILAVWILKPRHATSTNSPAKKSQDSANGR